MLKSPEDSKSKIITIRLTPEEFEHLEELAELFGCTNSEVLVDGMHMVDDLKEVILDLIDKKPELANVLRDNILHLLFNTEFRRDQIGEVTEKVLMGLMKKDLVKARGRANLILKLFNTKTIEEYRKKKNK